jgi:nicotinate-nucleotide pyrophosphorylase (carboxylating)
MALTESARATLALDSDAVERVVAFALAEDVGAGDVTTESTVDADARCRAELVVEEEGVVCGLPVAAAVFGALDERVSLERRSDEGDRIAPDTVVAELEGPARAILTGERTALNFLARLSGIATLTNRYVDAVAGTRAQILDTRKTTPGLRALEKYAVRCGGGTNHRFGLHDAVLVKENHIRAAGSITAAIEALRRADAALPVDVEAETFADIREALASGVERILLDNMTPDDIRAAVELVDGRAQLEASGGITLENVRAFAEAGVDFISIGALTHSVRSLHVSLEVR